MRKVISILIGLLVANIVVASPASADAVTSVLKATLSTSTPVIAVANMLALETDGDIWVSDSNRTAGASRVLLFDKNATASSSPKKIITGFTYASGLALDSAGNLYVSEGYAGKIYVFPANVGASAARSDATRVITAQGDIFSITVDAAGYIYAAHAFGGNSVLVYYPGTTNAASGALYKEIKVSNSNLNDAQGIGLAPNGDIAVSSIASDCISIFNASDSGTVVAKRTICGGLTQLNELGQIAFDADGRLYVSAYADDKVLIFAANADGNVAPIKVITGAGITSPWGIAVDATNGIWIANWDEANVTRIENPFVVTVQQSSSSSDSSTSEKERIQAAREKLEKAVAEAKTTIVSKHSSGSPLTVSDMSAADFNGVNSKNIDQINAEIQKISKTDPDSLNQIKRIVNKYEVAGRVSEGKRFYYSDLVSTGLAPTTSQFKSTIVRELAKMDESQVNSPSLIASAIAEIEAKMKARKERLAAVLAKAASKR